MAESIQLVYKSLGCQISSLHNKAFDAQHSLCRSFEENFKKCDNVLLSTQMSFIIKLCKAVWWELTVAVLALQRPHSSASSTLVPLTRWYPDAMEQMLQRKHTVTWLWSMHTSHHIHCIILGGWHQDNNLHYVETAVAMAPRQPSYWLPPCFRQRWGSQLEWFTAWLRRCHLESRVAVQLKKKFGFLGGREQRWWNN